MRFTTATSQEKIHFRKNILLKIYAVVFFTYWISTLATTPDFNNWMLENTLTIVFLAGLIVTHRAMRLSDLSYTFIFIYILLHVYGAKYTYAENPFGYWLKDMLSLSRNHYDRIVHFSFGFLLAYPMRDLFRTGLKFHRIVSWVLPVEITISFSCLYEIIEWAVADVLFPEQGVAYLGTQGDMWDAQKDMFLAFCGATLIMGIAYITKSIYRKYNPIKTNPMLQHGVSHTSKEQGLQL